MLDDVEISKAIIDSYSKELLEYTEVDVAIVGAGPAGMVAAYYLAKAGKKVAIFERKLSIGGGMWGGGMMFNKIVVQKEGKDILDEFEVKTEKYKDGYYTADSIEAVSTICSKAVKAGAKIFNLISFMDVMVTEKRVSGLVINWTPVDLTGMHVDPLSIRASSVIDATGHEACVASVVENKLKGRLDTPTGKIEGEKPMCAEKGEGDILKNTKEVYPGLYVVGMAANAVYGSCRMGPIFGGMLLSGKKAAEMLK